MFKKILLIIQIFIGVAGILFFGYSYFTASGRGPTTEFLIVLGLFLPLIIGGVGWIKDKKWGKVISILSMILICAAFGWGYYTLNEMFKGI